MTPDALSRQLHQITSLEQFFLEGGTDPDLKHYSYTVIDGERVMTFSAANLPHILLSSPYLYVNLHSRFQDYPAHIHDDWVELNYMYDGSATQIINQKSIQLNRGDFLLMDSDVIHKIEPLGENDILVNIIIRKQYFDHNFFNRIIDNTEITRFFLNSIVQGSFHQNYFHFPSNNRRRLNIFMEEFLCEWFSPSLHAREVLNDLLSLILTELTDILEHNIESSASNKDQISIVPILKYIETNYRTCTLESTAKFFNMNQNYLSGKLKKYTGFNFSHHLQHQKMSAAAKLLKNSDMSVTDISNYVGYENVSFFYRKFKEVYGCLPGEYRKPKFKP